MKGAASLEAAPFYVVGICAKIRTAGSELLKIVKRFGSGHGYWPLYCALTEHVRKNYKYFTKMLIYVLKF